MTRHRATTGASEEVIHKAVVAHLVQRAVPGVVWLHPANGEARTRITGAKLKGLGVVPGVSDLLILHRGTAYALELKRRDGRLQPSQVAFQDQWVAAGGRAAVAWGLDDALGHLEAWGIIR
jgi:hypothetical protein